MREQAGVIQKQVKLMEKDVVRLDERVAKLATHFNQAERDVVAIQTSTGKVARHIQKIEAVQLEDQSDAADEIEKGLDQLPPQ